MKKVLVAYYSEGGNTQKMAEYIAEGVRFSGQQAFTRSISEIKKASDLKDYDGYIIGSPTYLQDLPQPMKQFFSVIRDINPSGCLLGSFSSYTHDVAYSAGGQAAEIIMDSLQNQFKMKPFELGPLRLKEDVLGTSDGMKACQDYGKIFGQALEAQQSH
jgi:flavodoxin